MSMKKLWIAAAAMVLLAGCASIKTPINQTQVYGIENAYGVAQSAALGYIGLRRCGAGEVTSLGHICSQHSVIVKLANADQKARIALNALEAFTRDPKNYPGLTFSGLVSAAQQAVSVFQQIESTNQIGA
jgi:hypothetical protein